MPLESASYLSGLNPLNPAGSDTMSQGAAHLRLLKSTLKSTFPNIEGAVTATHTQLNDVAALRTELNAAKATITTLQSGLAGSATVPQGAILLWSGAVLAIPAGYTLCNGLNGTPDLRDRFVVGAGGSRNPGVTGGSSGGNLTTSAAGSHSHGGVTGGTTLSVAQMPKHTHGYPAGAGSTYTVSADMDGGSSMVQTEEEGDSQPHDHTISTDGNHTHTLAVDTTPPFYALAYIMKL